MGHIVEFPKIHFQKAHFIISAPDIRHLDKHLPVESGIEVAFAGRSNAGKSSALNRLTRQKGLARTSKTPGRTQLINVFEVEDGKRLIDLPGYGLIYLKLNKDIKIGDLRYKETAFSNSTDGFPITRKAFDRAWESVKDQKTP